MFSSWQSPEEIVCPYCEQITPPSTEGNVTCPSCKKVYYLFTRSKTLKTNPGKRDKKRLYDDIWHQFKTYEVEGGYNHPLDDYFALLCRARAQPLLDDILKHLLTTDNTLQNRRDELILLIGRIKPEFISDEIFNLVIENLSSDSTSVVDSTLQCLEQWGGKRSLEVLVNLKTGIDWLDSYAKDITTDLMKTELGYATSQT